MRYINRQLSTTGLFLTGIILLGTYLYSMRWNITLPTSLFWVSIGIIILTLVFQIIQINLYNKRVILLELCMACIAFHFIYQVPHFGLYGTDIFYDLASAKSILSSGYIRGNPLFLNETSHWPIIHLFGVVCSLLTEIDINFVVKWFPSFISTILVPLLYLLFKNVFNDDRIALFSILLYVCLQHNMQFASLFIRETIALISAVGCIYLYFSAKKSSNPGIKYILAIVFFLVTVLAHHLTSFMLLLFIALHFTVNKIIGYFKLGKHFSGEAITFTFLALSFVLTFSYWVYVVHSPLYTLASFIKDLFSPTIWGLGTYAEHANISVSSIPHLRGYILYFGFYFFHFILGIILFYNLLPRCQKQNKERRIEVYSFTLYLFLCGVVAIMSMFFIRARAFPDRFLMYGWLVGFAPLVLAILESNSQVFKKLGVSLLISFMIFNFYMIEPAAWSLQAKRQEVLSTTGVEEYTIAETIDFSEGKILRIGNSLNFAILDSYCNSGNGLSQDSNISEYEWILSYNKAFEYYFRGKQKTDMFIKMNKIANGENIQWNKLCETSKHEVYKAI